MLLYVITFHYLSFKNLHSITQGYSNIRSWCALGSGVVVNGRLCRYCLFEPPYPSWLFLAPSVAHIQKFPWLTQCAPLSLMCLWLHTSEWCFCPPNVFQNTGLNKLLWNSLVLCLHSQPRYSAGGRFRLCYNAFLCFGPWINHYFFP